MYELFCCVVIFTAMALLVVLVDAVGRAVEWVVRKLY